MSVHVILFRFVVAEPLLEFCASITPSQPIISQDYTLISTERLEIISDS